MIVFIYRRCAQLHNELVLSSETIRSPCLYHTLDLLLDQHRGAVVDTVVSTIMSNYIIPAHQLPRGLVRLYLYCGVLAVLAQNVAALALTAPLSLCQELGLDIELLHGNIAVDGQVHLHHNFLNEQGIQVLLDDIKDLETKSGKVVASGLSNTVKGSKQEFGQCK